MNAPRPTNIWLDWAAIGASGLCLVHCLALPLLIASLPALGDLAGSRTHWILLAFALPVSLWVLARDRGPAAFAPFVIGVAGLSLMTLGVALFEGHPEETESTIAGVLLVAAAHVLRWRRRRV